VPFCAHKCNYCAFYSEASRGEIVQRYVRAVINELDLVAEDLQPETVFFGGGTPSLLNLKQWEEILTAMERANLLGAAEWSIECNPATVSADKAKLWRSYGVNRLSLGVQSLHEPLLERLGRIHSRHMVFKSFDILRNSGFHNLNVDLMFAIPGQTPQVWRETLNEALALQSQHLSCYEVIYEEDTPLYAQLQAGEFSVNEDLACVMYEELLERTASCGLEQYEIANFARNSRPMSEAGLQRQEESAPRRQRSSLTRSMAANRRGSDSFQGVPASKASCACETGGPSEAEDIPTFACRHNINYWRGGSYYGLGPSAAGYVSGVRTQNCANTLLYCEQLEQGKRAINSTEELSPLQRAGEIAAFGLRMNSGWLLSQFRQATGYDLCRDWAAEVDQLVAKGWARITPRRFYLTAKGLRFADAAAELLLR
jgi:oxygen-independent coproporphyrinogen-3 oxidase